MTNLVRLALFAVALGAIVPAQAVFATEPTEVAPSQRVQRSSDAKLAPVSAFADLLILPPSTLRQVSGTHESFRWRLVRLSDNLPTFVAGKFFANYGATMDALGGNNAPVARWQLQANSAYASVAYSRYEPSGYSAWTDRLEPSAGFGEATFRPEPFSSIGVADQFRSSVQSYSSYQHSGGF